MKSELPLRLVLVEPPASIDYGIQRGRGSNYEAMFVQQRSRRMIIRIDDITWPLIRRAVKPGKRLEARIPGSGSDGGPSCATVNPIGGWKVVSD